MPSRKTTTRSVVPSAIAPVLPDEILDLDGCAALLKVKPTTIYSWTRSRSHTRIPHLRLGGKFLRFIKADVMVWLLSQRTVTL